MFLSGFEDFCPCFDYAVFLVAGKGGKRECIPDEGVGKAVVFLYASSHEALPSHKHGAFDNGKSGGLNNIARIVH